MPPMASTACTGAPRGVTVPLRGVTGPLPLPPPPSSGCSSGEPGAASPLDGRHMAEHDCSSLHAQDCWQRQTGCWRAGRSPSCSLAMPASLNGFITDAQSVKSVGGRHEPSSGRCHFVEPLLAATEGVARVKA